MIEMEMICVLCSADETTSSRIVGPRGCNHQACDATASKMALKELVTRRSSRIHSSTPQSVSCS